MLRSLVGSEMCIRDRPAAAAAALGGYLTTLNTKAENTWLYDKFGKYGGTSRDLWIGSKDNVTEGTWYWYNGTTSGDGGVSDNISAGSTWPDGQTKWACRNNFIWI